MKNLGSHTPDLDLIHTVKSGIRSFNRVFRRHVYEKHNWLCVLIQKCSVLLPLCTIWGDSLWEKSDFTDLNHLMVRDQERQASEIHIKSSLHSALLESTDVAEQLLLTGGVSEFITKTYYRIDIL